MDLNINKRNFNFIDKTMLLFVLLFNYPRFVNLATEHDAWCQEHPDLNLQHGHVSTDAYDRARQVKQGIAAGFLKVLAVGIIAIALGFTCAITLPMPSAAATLLEASGILLCVWGIVSFRGDKIWSIKRETLAELIDGFFYVATTLAGMFLLFFAVAFQLLSFLLAPSSCFMNN